MIKNMFCSYLCKQMSSAYKSNMLGQSVYCRVMYTVATLKLLECLVIVMFWHFRMVESRSGQQQTDRLEHEVETGICASDSRCSSQFLIDYKG